MFYMYILKSKKNDSLYFGFTNDLKKRFKEHNQGLSRYTNMYKPYELAYYEAYKSENDARQREINLKHRRNAWNQLKMRIVESIKTN